MHYAVDGQHQFLPFIDRSLSQDKRVDRKTDHRLKIHKAVGLSKPQRPCGLLGDVKARQALATVQPPQS